MLPQVMWFMAQHLAKSGWSQHGEQGVTKASAGERPWPREGEIEKLDQGRKSDIQNEGKQSSHLKSGMPSWGVLRLSLTCEPQSECSFCMKTVQFVRGVFGRLVWESSAWEVGIWTLGSKTLGGCPESLTSAPHPTFQEGHTQACLLTPIALGSLSRRPCPSTALNDSSCEISHSF